MQIANAKKVNVDEVKKVLSDESSKSAKIRKLFEIGLKVSEIAKLLEIRYQFANNIVNQYVLKANLEVSYEKKSSIVDAILSAK